MSSTSPSFIGEYFIKESLCDKLIDFFHSTPEQHSQTIPDTNTQHWYTKMPGKVGTYDPRIDRTVKDSMDLTFSYKTIFSPDLPVAALPFSDMVHEYIEALGDCIREYGTEYTHSLESAGQIQEGINLQHYPPGAGYPNLHCERQSSTLPYVKRHLVFMTYLNTVTDEGGTHFKYQNYTATAGKGKTLIWPSDWTHMHQGVISPTQEKYIMTGWISHTEPTDIWVDNRKSVQLLLDL